MRSNELHADLYGWWRIVETSQWVNDGLDDLGLALISITGYGDPTSAELPRQVAMALVTRRLGQGT
jgi:hypothetical protein